MKQFVWSDIEWNHVRPSNWAFDPPLFDATSYALPSVEEWESFLAGTSDAWCYSSDSHPTGATLAKIIATMQKRSHCLLTASGKSAIAQSLLGLVSAGDEIILLKEAYKSTRFFAEQILARFGVRSHLVSVDECDRIEELLGSGRVRVLMLESPTNPQCRVPDMMRLCQYAHQNDVYVVLDNSMSGFHQHGEVPADVFVHSLSKFTSSSADVMGGAIIADKEVYAKIVGRCAWSADVLDPRAAHILLKGMQTYSLRRERQSQSAFLIAKQLEREPTVESILYPGLASHPDHELATTLMTDYGVIISFNYAGSGSDTKRFINRLKRFKIAFGSAYPTSIVSPGYLFYGRGFPKGEISRYAIEENTVRLSIGLEDPALLLEDLTSNLRMGS